MLGEKTRKLRLRVKCEVTDKLYWDAEKDIKEVVNV